MEINTKNAKPRRSIALWILGVFTMLNSGLSALSYFVLAFYPQIIINSVETMKTTGFFEPEQIDLIVSTYTSMPSWQFIALAIVEIGLFVGAFIMLVKLDRIGFHIYTISKITQFCILNFVIGAPMAMDLSAIIMAVLWVLMFATQLPLMKQTDDDNSNDNNNQEI